jgi:hypothetical protein
MSDNKRKLKDTTLLNFFKKKKKNGEDENINFVTPVEKNKEGSRLVM